LIQTSLKVFDFYVASAGAVFTHPISDFYELSKRVMEISLHHWGIIQQGDNEGWYVFIQDDVENTGGYLVIVAKSPDLNSTEGFDGWAEDIDALEGYIQESKWVIDWIPSRQPTC